jgi:hypothetical protein
MNKAMISAIIEAARSNPEVMLPNIEAAFNTLLDERDDLEAAIVLLHNKTLIY